MAPPKPKKESAKQIEPDKMPELSETVAEVLFQRIEELDKLIKPMEEQLEPLQSEYREIAAF